MSTIQVKASTQFFDDARRLPDAVGRKLEATVRLLRERGVTYGSLKTRPIERNPDRRFRLMNVDAGYRIVAAVEGDLVAYFDFSDLMIVVQRNDELRSVICDWSPRRWKRETGGLVNLRNNVMHPVRNFVLEKEGS